MTVSKTSRRVIDISTNPVSRKPMVKATVDVARPGTSGRQRPKR
jgi:hypothetical protein